MPKVSVKILFESQLAASTPLYVAFTELFSLCLKELLSEYSYYADCAGIHLLDIDLY